MTSILNIEPGGYSPEARAILAELGVLSERQLDRNELLASIGTADVLIVRLAHQIDREVIEAGVRLRAIVSATTGLDHIDVACAEQRGVAVISLRGEGEFLRTVPVTAEHTWALLLALVRRIPWAAEAVRNGEWNRDAYRGRELSGCRLGIVGLGRLGRVVARYGAAFGMNAAAFDPYQVDWPEEVERAPSLEALFRSCNIVSLHVPLNSETYGLIGATELSWLSSDALLVNTSRGDLVDEEALCWSLEQGTLAGAALDVLSHEREPDRRRAGPLMGYLRTHDNLLVTPHIGGASHVSMARSELFVVRKLAAFLHSQRGGGRAVEGTGPGS